MTASSAVAKSSSDNQIGQPTCGYTEEKSASVGGSASLSAGISAIGSALFKSKETTETAEDGTQVTTRDEEFSGKGAGKGHLDASAAAAANSREFKHIE